MLCALSFKSQPCISSQCFKLIIRPRMWLTAHHLSILRRSSKNCRLHFPKWAKNQQTTKRAVTDNLQIKCLSNTSLCLNYIHISYTLSSSQPFTSLSTTRFNTTLPFPTSAALLIFSSTAYQPSLSNMTMTLLSFPKPSLSSI